MSDLQISIYIEANNAGSETCTDPARLFSYTQNIGELEPGVYDVKVFVNDSEKMSRKLYVSSGEIEILDKGKYIDSQGDVHVVGDVRNITNFPVQLVELQVSFIKENQVIKQDRVFTTMAVLMPNATSGFDLLATDEELRDAYSLVSVLSYQKTTPKPQGLRLVVESMELEPEGRGLVSGKIYNEAKIDANQVKVVCVFYDKSHTTAIDSTFDYTNPSTIKVGNRSEFKIYSHNKPADSDFMISCNAESLELTTQTIQLFNDTKPLSPIEAIQRYPSEHAGSGSPLLAWDANQTFFLIIILAIIFGSLTTTVFLKSRKRKITQ
ncbi:MAG: hypothetical protein ACRD92_05920 [Nitrosopumilaceae archaeon]